MESAFGKALGAALMIAALGFAAVPVRAQLASPGTQPTAEQSAGARLPEATVQRTGAAIRDLSGIQARYNQRMQSAQPAERQAIEEEANNAAQARRATRATAKSPRRAAGVRPDRRSTRWRRISRSPRSVWS